jgi:hypothetical protein
MSEEQKTKLAKKRGPEHHRYGEKHTPEVIELMIKNHPNTKPVYVYTEDKKTLIARYVSLKDMENKTGVTRNTIARKIKQGELVSPRRLKTKWFCSYTELTP